MLTTVFFEREFMNKISLISLALSALFCWNVNASEQPADQPNDNLDVVSSEQQPASEPTVSDSENNDEVKVKKAKVSKKKKSKKCSKSYSKSCKRTNEFTEDLNNDRSPNVEPSKEKSESKDEPKDK